MADLRKLVLVSDLCYWAVAFTNSVSSIRIGRNVFLRAVMTYGVFLFILADKALRASYVYECIDLKFHLAGLEK